MTFEHDLVIRGGTIVDGSGGDPVEADVAIAGDRVVSVGANLARGREELDARGKLVTPGFIDVHTHYDGQVTWENTLSPSSEHGVTSVVMGNCGVGFAPIRQHQRQLAIELMEGVEDIPGVVMAEGLPWNWETFPEYLDALAVRRTDIDFAAQLPHSPLRVYVMGERGAALEPPTDDDLAAMRRLTTEAVKAGAIGVSTSRTLAHRFRDGRPAPSTRTEEDELMNLADGLRDAGKGVFQLIPDFARPAEGEMALIERLQTRSGRPVSFTLVQNDNVEGGWRTYLQGIHRAVADGRPVRGQVFPRPIGMLFGLSLSLHPFALNPSYKKIADLPLEERVRIMRDPAFRRALLAEQAEDTNDQLVYIAGLTDWLFPLGDPPNYTPLTSDSIRARAELMGVDARELLYDELLKDEGRAIIYCPRGNMDEGRLDSGSLVVREPGTLLGLGDGGAHYGMICDAGWPTFFLTRCVRDAPADRKVALPQAVAMMSRQPAAAMGFADRGLVAPGWKADLNIIDFDALHLHGPEIRHDLPANGRRLAQRADGFDATIVSGQVTYREAQATGNLPGRLIRS